MTYFRSALVACHPAKKATSQLASFMAQSMQNCITAKAAARRHLMPGIALASLLAIGTPVAAQAAVTSQDIQLAGRVLGFVNPPISGDIKLGIVYDPANAASTADEQSVVTILGSGLTIGSINIIPVPVPLASLATAQVGAFFLTSGLGAGAAAVGKQAGTANIVCITTNAAANAAASCAVAVQTDPTVQITINKAAITPSDFNSSFILMVKEI